MPVDSGGQYYEAAQSLSDYDVGPRIVTASGESSVIEVGDTEELHAVLGSHEFYVTALSGANNDIAWIARAAGASSLTITYVVSGASTPLSVVKTTSNIVVNVATSAGSAATSTANDIIAAVLEDETNSTSEVAVVPVLAAGNDGTGVVTALSQQPLAPPTGTSPTLDVKLQTSIDDGSSWADVAAFTQKNSAVVDRKVFVGLGDYAKWVWTIGGSATPTFALSLSATGKGE